MPKNVKDKVNERHSSCWFGYLILLLYLTSLGLLVKTILTIAESVTDWLKLWRQIKIKIWIVHACRITCQEPNFNATPISLPNYYVIQWPTKNPIRCLVLVVWWNLSIHIFPLVYSNFGSILYSPLITWRQCYIPHIVSLYKNNNTRSYDVIFKSRSKNKN